MNNLLMKIELLMSGNTNPPGYKGMGCNATSYWLKIDGEWYSLPHRSGVKAKRDLLIAIDLIGAQNCPGIEKHIKPSKSAFALAFDDFARKHHQMMVNKGFHGEVNGMFMRAGTIVCSRIRGQTKWLEKRRKGILDHKRFSDDFGLEVEQNPIKTNQLLKCALIATELTELVEEIIKDHVNDDACAEECADIVLRVMDLAMLQCWDLSQALEDKMLKNKSRPYLHGKGF